MQTHRIVLSGGPCAGKTTALVRLTERLESFGCRVYRVPEVATLLISGGAPPPWGGGDAGAVEFQVALIRLQTQLEDAFVQAAAASGKDKSVILCDRGAMDSRAYVTDAAWQAVLDEGRWSVVGLRDARYDAVVHMVTAADGAEHAYTTANNAARTETPEQARALDMRTREAWVGHPHMRIVPNRQDGFEGKLRRALGAVCRVVGIPEPIEHERKFLVRSVDEIPVRFETVEIEQTYLRPSDPGTVERVRRRGVAGSYVYYHTVKREVRPGERIELERQVGARDYLALLERADPLCETIRKTRTCIPWEGWYFELDRFGGRHQGLTLLEAELDPGVDDPLLAIPPFVDVEREVTDDGRYANANLALREGVHRRTVLPGEA